MLSEEALSINRFGTTFHIPWAEVRGLEKKMMQSRPVYQIIVGHPEQYIDGLKGFYKWNANNLFKYHGTPFILVPKNLKMKETEAIDLFKQYMA